MSNEANEKIASDIRKLKQHGFINHLKAAGTADSEVERLHGLYKEQDARREEKLVGTRDAILAGLKED